MLAEMLDSNGEDQNCEELDDWSTFSSADWTGPHPDNSTPGQKDPAVPVMESSTHPKPGCSAQVLLETKQEAAENCVFHHCFQVEKAEEEVVEDIPTLSQLLQPSTDTSGRSTAISSGADRFWSHLQSEFKLFYLPGLKPKLYSQDALVRCLQLTEPDGSLSSQSSSLSDLDLDDLDNPPKTLIQTKLAPSSSCRNAPGFLYQISQQWIDHYRSSFLQDQRQDQPLTSTLALFQKTHT